MSGCHAVTVTRCDSRADFDACPYCGYSAVGEPFGAYPCSGYREGSRLLLHKSSAQNTHRRDLLSEPIACVCDLVMGICALRTLTL